MKKKLVLGCIAASFILVAVIFTSLVSVQAVESNIVKESPLFEVKTRQSIDVEYKEDITSAYIGEEKDTVITDLLQMLNSIKNKYTSLELTNSKYMFSFASVCEDKPSVCYPIPTCDFFCRIISLVLILFITALICTGEGGLNINLNGLEYKLQNNAYFEGLIIENPEILPEILELNN